MHGRALSYPYSYTGDEWFGEMTEALLSAVGPNTRSAAWLYTSLAHAAWRITPLEVTLPDGAAVCAADEPWSGQVQLQHHRRAGGGDAAGFRARPAHYRRRR